MTQYLGQSHDLIRLREATVDDARLLWEKAYNNQQFMQQFRAHDQVTHLEQLKSRIIRSKQMAFVSNGFKQWIIEHRERGPVGWAILADFCYQRQQAEFLTGVWEQGKGLLGAGAAANMLLWEYGFKALKLREMYALVYANNKKPQKILSAMGLSTTTSAAEQAKGLIRFTLGRQQFFSHKRLARLTCKTFGRDFTQKAENSPEAEGVMQKPARMAADKTLAGKFPHVQQAVSLAALSVPVLGSAVEFNVTEATDDGSGMVTNSLSWAILQANTAVGDDVITLNTDVTLTGVMKRLIDSNVVIQSDGVKRTITGEDSYRPLFIKSGTVLINNINITNGMAQGGHSNHGGPGAGLGGGLFIYDGYVTLKQVAMNGNTAQGGLNDLASEYYGGGGMGVTSPSANDGGGLFSGNYGGYGAYRNNDSNFGGGGTSSSTAGFGGGGWGVGLGYYESGGHGGFGGGGGKGGHANAEGGDGGFGAGGGTFIDNGTAGSPGYGAHNTEGAGMGGALFIRSGSLHIQYSSFSNNQADGHSGLGGALFVLSITHNTNNNNQGMPAQLATVSGCHLTFANNIATTNAGSPLNNDDYFDAAGLIGSGNGFDELCSGDLIFKNSFE